MPESAKHQARTAAILAVFAFMFFLSGCVQEKECLIIEKDGSGTLEVNTLIPKATADAIDEVLDGIMRQAELAAQSANTSGRRPSSTRASEKMFGNKDEILKKAEKAGLNVEVISYESSKKEDGIHVDYKLKFDSVDKLLKSGIMGTKLRLIKDGRGNLVCSLKSDEKKACESKEQLKQFKDSQAKEQLKTPDDPNTKAILEAMRNFKVELFITMPSDITKVSGMFTKTGSKTAYLKFSGDLFASPDLVDKLYGLSSSPSDITCGSGGVTFELSDDAAGVN